MSDHSMLLKAFEEIRDSNALAWSILDSKSELAVNLALALSVNRLAGRQVAHVEYRRIDLVFMEDRHPTALYEAKAAYATDFQPARIERNDWYLGECVNRDLAKLRDLHKKYPVEQVAALFYLYEVSDPKRQLKYGRRPLVDTEVALTALNDAVTSGRLVNARELDCGAVDGTNVKIRLSVFEPLPPLAGDP